MLQLGESGSRWLATEEPNEREKRIGPRPVRLGSVPPLIRYSAHFVVQWHGAPVVVPHRGGSPLAWQVRLRAQVNGRDRAP
jgi:hypothetical protein